MEFELAKKVDLDTKQDKLTAGDNITIDSVTNTISGTAQYDDTQIKADIDTKQDKIIVTTTPPTTTDGTFDGQIWLVTE